MDSLSPADRSANMAKIRGKGMRPEIVVRQAAHALGYRFRLHRADLPGKPDLVFASRRKVIFVNGCYWHRHSCKRGQSLPGTNTAFWQAKLEGNAERDARVATQLRALGWEVVVIWECETKDLAALESRLRAYLN